MYIVKYEDSAARGAKEAGRRYNQKDAIDLAEQIKSPGRWVTVFDEETGKPVYNERED